MRFWVGNATPIDPGEIMTAKKLWAIILIVVGVVFFLGGIKAYHEAHIYRNELKYIDNQFSRAGLGRLDDSGRYERLLHNEKVKGIIGSLLGIAMAIGGTMLLPQKKRKNTVVRSRTRELDSDFPNL